MLGVMCTQVVAQQLNRQIIWVYLFLLQNPREVRLSWNFTRTTVRPTKSKA
jgi:hypothetical protein